VGLYGGRAYLYGAMILTATTLECWGMHSALTNINKLGHIIWLSYLSMFWPLQAKIWFLLGNTYIMNFFTLTDTSLHFTCPFLNMLFGKTNMILQFMAIFVLLLNAKSTYLTWNIYVNPSCKIQQKNVVGPRNWSIAFYFNLKKNLFKVS
jgi:hypothetical protein